MVFLYKRAFCVHACALKWTVDLSRKALDWPAVQGNGLLEVNTQFDYESPCSPRKVAQRLAETNFKID